MLPAATQQKTGVKRGEGILTGTYRAEGRNPDGFRYSGRVTVADGGDRLDFRWEMGSQIYTGTGRR